MMTRITPRASLGLFAVMTAATACTDRGPIGYGDGNAAGNTSKASSGGSQGKAGGASGGGTSLSLSSASGVGGSATSSKSANGGAMGGTATNAATSTATGSGGSGGRGGASTPMTTSISGGTSTVGGANTSANSSGGSTALANGGASSTGGATVTGGTASRAGAASTGGAPNSGGTAGSSAASAGAAGAGAQQWLVDPASLYFFNLPIDSVRWGIAGYVPSQRTCVSVIWDYSNTGHSDGAHCNEFAQMFPYVTMTTNMDGPCRDWTYGGTVQVNDWTGCVDFQTYMGMDYVNSVVSVTSDLFTGQIVLDNRSLLGQQVVIMGLKADVTATKPIYVQLTAGQQIPAWITATKDGADVALFDRCDIPRCSGTKPNCTASTHVSSNAMGRSGSNSIGVTWDGYLRRLDSTNNCLATEPAPAGNYRAQFCYANAITSTTTGSSDVVNPQCVTRDFTYPTDQVFVTVSGS